MKISDRLRRAVVGLGSAALATALGLGVHFVAGDRIGLRAGGLAGGDALAADEVAWPLGTVPVGLETLRADAMPSEGPARSELVTQPRRSANDEGEARGFEDDELPMHSGESPVPATDDVPEAGGDDADPEALPAAQAEVAGQGSGADAPSGQPSAFAAQDSENAETPRVSAADEGESDDDETEPREDEPEHDSESAETEDDPSSEDEPEDD